VQILLGRLQVTQLRLDGLLLDLRALFVPPRLGDERCGGYESQQDDACDPFREAPPSCFNYV
jgi:hypothetical protein